MRWFDFRGKHDKFADYFTNSVIATKVHKLWCLEISREFPDYTEDLWGVTASDSARGYAVWGGPPPMGRLDGSVVPCATGGSLPFLPEETLRVLRTIRSKYEQRTWKRYGFVDAFNPLTNWYSQDVLGIDARNHDADGGKFAYGIYLGTVHEERHREKCVYASGVPCDSVQRAGGRAEVTDSAGVSGVEPEIGRRFVSGGSNGATHPFCTKAQQGWATLTAEDSESRLGGCSTSCGLWGAACCAPTRGRFDRELLGCSISASAWGCSVSESDPLVNGMVLACGSAAAFRSSAICGSVGDTGLPIFSQRRQRRTMLLVNDSKDRTVKARE